MTARLIACTSLPALSLRAAARVELDEHLLDQQAVDVIAAETGVAVGREHLEDAVLDPEDRDVEGSAAKVVDSDQAGVMLVETVGERRGGRLVDDAEHLEAGNPAGVAGRRTLGVVEVGRHGDHRTIDIRLDLALLGKVLLGAALELAQDEGRDLGRRELTPAETDPHHSAGIPGQREGNQPRLRP